MFGRGGEGFDCGIDRGGAGGRRVEGAQPGRRHGVLVKARQKCPQFGPVERV